MIKLSGVIYKDLHSLNDALVLMSNIFNIRQHNEETMEDLVIVRLP